MRRLRRHVSLSAKGCCVVLTECVVPGLGERASPRDELGERLDPLARAEQLGQGKGGRGRPEEVTVGLVEDAVLEDVGTRLDECTTRTTGVFIGYKAAVVLPEEAMTGPALGDEAVESTVVCGEVGRGLERGRPMLGGSIQPAQVTSSPDVDPVRECRRLGDAAQVRVSRAGREVVQLGSILGNLVHSLVALDATVAGNPLDRDRPPSVGVKEGEY